MRRFLLTLFSVSIAVVAVADAKFDTSGSVALMGRFSAAHACAVDSDWAITAAHVTDLEWSDESVPLVPYRYETDAGDRGIADPRGVYMSVDLGWLWLTNGSSTYYDFAENELPDGEKVYWIEYEIEKKSKSFKGQLRSGKIITTVAGHIFVDEAPVSGASGGCAWNEKGEVVGVVVAAWKIGNSYDFNVGMIVSTSGQWAPVIPEEKDAEE